MRKTGDDTQHIGPSAKARHLYALIQQQAQFVLSLRADQTTQQEEERGALLYLGNIHDSVPRNLLFDPLLEPTEQVTWQALRILVNGQGGRFPQHSAVQPMIKCGRTRFLDAIAILRLTRWISAAPVRDRQGRIYGRVYALHDDRAPLSDAMLLDPSYVEFVRKRCEHNNPRISRTAINVREELGLETRAMVEDEANLNFTASPTPQLQRNVSRFFSNNGQFSRFGLNNGDDQSKVQNQHFGCDAHFNPKSGNATSVESSKMQIPYSGSSSNPVNIKKTNLSKLTTTTTKASGFQRGIEIPQVLVNTFDSRQISALVKLLESIPDQKTAQEAIDESAGCLLADIRGEKQLKNPFAFARAVILRAADGQFVPTEFAFEGWQSRQRGNTEFAD